MSRLNSFRGAVLFAGVALVCLAGAPSHAGSHLWVVQEIFSNADGTVQFVELKCPFGAPNEVNLAGKNLFGDLGVIHAFTENLPFNSTNDKHLLLATQAFADLPGAPTPDHIIEPDSFALDDDMIQWHIYDDSILSFGVGELPTDGIHSLSQSGTVAVNSPTNFAGQFGSVDASSGPPAVPSTGTPMSAQRLDASGSSVKVLWDTTTCPGTSNHQILYGHRSDLPSTHGGGHGLQGAVCGLGAVSSHTWSSMPVASDGSGLLWWVVVVEASGEEGSWGRESDGTERAGSGPGGSSAACGVGGKSVDNVCGQ